MSIVHPQNAGFSLMELLIAVAIVGILAALAYPSYTGYVQKSRRSDIQSQMGTFAQQLERGYSKNGQYQVADAGLDVLPTNKHYKLDIVLVLGPDASRNARYTMTATARATGTQTNDTARDGTSCATLTWNQTGSKTPEACWPT